MKKILLALMIVLSGCLEKGQETDSNSQAPPIPQGFTNSAFWDYEEYGAIAKTMGQSSVKYSSTDIFGAFNIKSKSHAKGDNIATTMQISSTPNPELTTNLTFDFSPDESNSVQIFVTTDNSGTRYFITEVVNSVNYPVVLSTNPVSVSGALDVTMTRGENGDVVLTINNVQYNFSGYGDSFGYIMSIAGQGETDLTNFALIGAKF